jgi:uncharacterized membrane protein
MSSAVNVSRPERWASVIGGAALAAAGVRRFVAEDRPVGSLLTAAGAGLILRGATGHCNVYAATGINTAAAKNDTRARLAGQAGINVEESVAIQQSAEELYVLWRDFECLPTIFPNLESVRHLGNGRSRWTAVGPAGRRVEWTAEIINEIPGRLIAWRTIDAADLVSAGSVHFTPLPGNRGTSVRVRLQYEPPGGRIGNALAWLLGKDPSHSLREGLRRFKQVIEAGELPTNEPQARGAQ